MQHDDYIWIAIRVLGLYLVFRAAVAGLQLVLHINAALGFAFSETSDLQAKAWFGAGGSLLELVVLFWLGRYMLFDGQRVFAWVKRGQEALQSKRAA